MQASEITPRDAAEAAAVAEARECADPPASPARPEIDRTRTPRPFALRGMAKRVADGSVDLDLDELAGNLRAAADRIEGMERELSRRLTPFDRYFISLLTKFASVEDDPHTMERKVERAIDYALVAMRKRGRV